MITACIFITILALIWCFICFKSKSRFPYLLYSYALFCVLANTIMFFYANSNYLGVGKAWSFQEIYLVALILGTPFILPPLSSSLQQKNIIITIKILLLLVAGSLILGFLRPDNSEVTAIARRFIWLPTFFSALRIFTTRKHVESFYKLICYFVFPVFLYHMLIALKIVSPPVPELQQLAMEYLMYQEIQRVEHFFSPIIYLIAIAVSLSEVLQSRQSHRLLNLSVLLVSGIGVLLSQTRSYYLMMAVIVYSAFILLKGRLKLALFVSVACILIFAAISVSSINVFARFTNPNDDVGIPAFQEYAQSWRGQEWFTLFGSYLQEPYLFLTGQGMGAPHTIVLNSASGTVNFYHNEYLKVLSTLGFIGLACHFMLLYWGVRGYRQTGHVVKDWIFAPIRLISVGFMPGAIFVGCIWHPAVGTIFICFLAILTNGNLISVNDRTASHHRVRLKPPEARRDWGADL